MHYKLLNGYRYFKTAGVAAVLASFVWWCVLYPELSFPQDTYEVVYETDEEADAEALSKSGADAGTEALENMDAEAGADFSLWDAKDEQIVVRSGLLEWLRERKKTLK